MKRKKAAKKQANLKAFKQAAARAAGTGLDASNRFETLVATKAFKAHHDVVERAGVRGGDRRYTRLNQFLVTGFINPEECLAGLRYINDHTIGVIGPGDSCIADKIRGSGDGHPNDARLDATTRYRVARTAVDAGYRLRVGQLNASFVMELLLISDESISEIARRIGCKDSAAKNGLRGCLETLSAHYRDVDRINGRSTTAFTMDVALSRFEPIEDDAIRAARGQSRKPRTVQ